MCSSELQGEVEVKASCRTTGRNSEVVQKPKPHGEYSRLELKVWLSQAAGRGEQAGEKSTLMQQFAGARPYGKLTQRFGIRFIPY